MNTLSRALMRGADVAELSATYGEFRLSYVHYRLLRCCQCSLLQ